MRKGEAAPCAAGRQERAERRRGRAVRQEPARVCAAAAALPGVLHGHLSCSGRAAEPRVCAQHRTVNVNQSYPLRIKRASGF